MKTLFRFFSFLAFCGSLYWIYRASNEVEPYVVALASLAAIAGSFIEIKKSKPEINVELVTVGPNSHSFIVSNTGNQDAYEVNLKFNLKDSQRFPIRKKPYENTFPVKTIFKNDYKEIIATLSFESGIEFDITWSWKNKKGKSFSRGNIVSLKR